MRAEQDTPPLRLWPIRARETAARRSTSTWLPRQPMKTRDIGYVTAFYREGRGRRGTRALEDAPTALRACGFRTPFPPGAVRSESLRVPHRGHRQPEEELLPEHSPRPGGLPSPPPRACRRRVPVSRPARSHGGGLLPPGTRDCSERQRGRDSPVPGRATAKPAPDRPRGTRPRPPARGAALWG